MYDVYANSDPRLAAYYARASRWRSRFLRMLVRRGVRAAKHYWARLACQRKLRRAINELSGLSNAALKDIGVPRSEIASLVAAAQKPPCGRGENFRRIARQRAFAAAAPTPRYVSGRSTPQVHATALSP